MRCIFAAVVLTCVFNQQASAGPRLCENWESYAIAQMDVSFMFANQKYNTNEFMNYISPRISYGDRSRFIESIDSWRDGDAYISRFCLAIGDLDPKSIAPLTTGDIPSRFRFAYGPRVVDFSVSDLSQRFGFIMERGSREDEPHANVVEMPYVVDLDPVADPDWLTIETARLARLANGTTALRLVLYNAGEERTAGVRMQLSATNTPWGGCASQGHVVQATVAVREISGELIAETTELDFGDAERRQVNVMDGPCGQLEISFPLGVLPAIAPRDDMKVNFQFEDVYLGDSRDGPFWSVFLAGRVEFSGAEIWPNSIHLQTPM